MDASTPRIIREGFDAYGQPKEFVQQFPTPERAAKIASRIEHPEVSRLVIRHHTRIKGIWELMAGRGTITADQQAAAEKLEAAIAGLHGSPPAAYGLLSGSGESPASFKDRCRETVTRAKAVTSPEMFEHLYAMAHGNLTAEGVGYEIGARSKRNAYRLGGKAVAEALQAMHEAYAGQRRMAA